jgi:hypothetical protein
MVAVIEKECKDGALGGFAAWYQCGRKKPPADG